MKNDVAGNMKQNNGNQQINMKLNDLFKVS